MKTKVKNLDKKMKEIHGVALKCVEAMILKGTPEKQATDMVLEVLKETLDKGAYEIGGVAMVKATLKMTFMDETPEQAGKELIKNILK